MSLLDTAEILRLKILLNKGRLPNTKEIKANLLALIASELTGAERTSQLSIDFKDRPAKW